jgi:hypothetical protein
MVETCKRLWVLKNVSAFELQSIEINDCNLAIRLIESM